MQNSQDRKSDDATTQHTHNMAQNNTIDFELKDKSEVAKDIILNIIKLS